MIFAETMPPVESAWNLLPTVFTALMAVGTWGLYWNSRKRNRSEIYPQPLNIRVEEEFSKKFASRGECDERHGSVEADLERHQSEIGQLWNTLRSENTVIRTEVNQKFDTLRHEMAEGFTSVSRALGRIEGKQDQ